MSRFSFDPHHAPADAYRHYFRAARATSGRASADTPPPPTESTTPVTERAIPQADGEP